MTVSTIDNSLKEDLNKVILWQYETAEHLCDLIGTKTEGGVTTRGMFPTFFNSSTEALWDAIAGKLNIANPLQADNYGLSVWGKLLGVSRPDISTTVDDVTTVSTMSTELFRKIIVARLRLLMSNASVDAYSQFCAYVFGGTKSIVDGKEVWSGGNVGVTDGFDMSISFSWIGPESPTGAVLEQKNALEQVPDSIFVYPSGIKSSTESDSMVFGFYEQVRDEDGDPLTTNAVIDNQSVQTDTYTYTKNGYTYTKQHKDFKIGNLDHGSIAWDRFSR